MEKIIRLQTKILLAKAIIKNWNQATKPEEKSHWTLMNKNLQRV